MKKKILTLTLLSMLLTFPMSVTSCDPTPNEVEVIRDTVTNYDLGNGNKYSGQMRDSKIDGTGTIKFKNGDELNGTFKEGKLDSSVECEYKFKETGYNFKGLGTLNDDFSFSMNEGTLTLTGKRSYTGKFKDNLYEDEEGTFDFGTNTKYVGPFVKGSNVGLVGTIYYPPSALNGEGVWYFTGEMASLGKFKLNQLGVGKIKFGDWSVYEGQIYHDTDNGWWRKGKGVQDFTGCAYSASEVGGPSNLYLGYYDGNFDYSVTEWIYGNGVMYYLNDNLEPAGYMKGFFNALKRSGEPTEDIPLREEFKNTKEYAYDPQNLRSAQYQEKYKGKQPDIIFCGDSYMDMWQSSYGLANYEYDTKDYNCINTGIGGTVGSEWVILSEKLVKDFSPKKVFFHLGFNDTHMGFTKDQIIDSFTTISNSLVSSNPNISIYFLGIEPSPTFASYFEKETINNNAIKALCDSKPNLTFVDTNNLFIENGEPISDLRTYFSPDYVHMNSKGYQLWFNKIKEYI